jgi:3-dehydroquinate dehydratase II
VSQIIYVINGPNLNLLGSREPGIYGHTTLDDIENLTDNAGKACDFSVEFRQSNEEGTLVNWIQEAHKTAAGLIINAAGYTHTSVAIMDALLAAEIPVIEVHLSNIYKREEFRHHSYISRAASGIICGFGAHGYVLAVEAMAKLLKSDQH